LIALSGCLASEIPELILRDQPDRARAAIDWFKQVFGPDISTSSCRTTVAGAGEGQPATDALGARVRAEAGRHQ
jgi:DNA polymerase III alpha subunit